MSEATEGVEAEYAALWETAVMVLEDNARRQPPEKAAAVAVNREHSERLDD